MFGPNNSFVLEKLVSMKQKEINDQVKWNRLADESAANQATWTQNVAWTMGQISITLGRWLQKHASTRAESITQVECA